MAAAWAELGAWAATLSIDAIPPEVLDTARQVQLGLVGAHRRADPARPEQAWGVESLGGELGPGVGEIAWTAARARPRTSLRELLVATVAGLELGSRAGVAASGLGVAPPGVAARVAGAVAAARLRGDDAAAVAASLEGAWGGAELRLPRAWGGLGTAWLARTAILPALPVPVHAAAAVEAVDEILARHVRAAGKRLRADQVERVEIGVPGMVLAADGLAAPGRRIAARVAELIASHSLLPGAGGGSGREADIRVDLRRSARGSVVQGVGLAEVGAGIGMFDAGELWRARAEGRLRLPGPREWGRAVRSPDLRALAILARGDRGWDDGALARWRWPLPAEVRLWTTRGGWWPERRAGPRGAGDTLAEVARERWAGEAGREEAYARLAGADLDATGWLEAAWS